MGRFTRWCGHWYDHLIRPVFPIPNPFHAAGLYLRYLNNWRTYRTLPGAEPVRLYDGFPCLFDAGPTRFDPDYFYQAAWAMERILKAGAARHVDIGSDVKFVGMLSTQLSTAFVDIRPFAGRLPHLTSVAGSLLALPFQDRSVASLSCLHVAEHVGLGRYGDPLDPYGATRACDELRRILAPGGHLFFSIPVGRPRVCFNAHRVLDPGRVMTYFSDLELREFSAVDDGGVLHRNTKFDLVRDAQFACGLFWFQRPSAA